MFLTFIKCVILFLCVDQKNKVKAAVLAESVSVGLNILRKMASQKSSEAKRTNLGKIRIYRHI